MFSGWTVWLIVYACVCLCDCASLCTWLFAREYRCSQRSEGSNVLVLDLEVVVSHLTYVVESNSGPLHDQRAFLTAEPFCKHLSRHHQEEMFTNYLLRWDC